MAPDNVNAEKLHADEFDIDDALVRRLLRAQFPELADRRLARFPSIGTVNAIYRLGDDLSVRVPRTERFTRDLASEYETLTRLAPQLPLPIPEPVGLGAPSAEFPHPWAIYRWLEGEQCAAVHGSSPRIARQLAEFVTTLRAIRPAVGPVSGRAELLPDRDGVTRRSLHAARDVLDVHVVTSAWETSLAVTQHDGHDVWIHGDLLPPNLLVHGDEIAAVLDFGCAGIGDPACDLIAAWSVLTGHARDIFRSEVAVDDATWLRGRGWALSIALLIIPYYAVTNPPMVAMARHTVGEIVADQRRTG